MKTSIISFYFFLSIIAINSSCDIRAKAKKDKIDADAAQDDIRNAERSLEYKRALMEYQDLFNKNAELEKEIRLLETKKVSFSQNDFKKLAQAFEGSSEAEVSKEVAYLHSGPEESLINLDEYLEEGKRVTLLEITKGFAKITFSGNNYKNDRWIKLRDLRTLNFENNDSPEN